MRGINDHPLTGLFSTKVINSLIFYEVLVKPLVSMNYPKLHPDYRYETSLESMICSRNWNRPGGGVPAAGGHSAPNKMSSQDISRRISLRHCTFTVTETVCADNPDGVTVTVRVLVPFCVTCTPFPPPHPVSPRTVVNTIAPRTTSVRDETFRRSRRGIRSRNSPARLTPPPAASGHCNSLLAEVVLTTRTEVAVCPGVSATWLGVKETLIPAGAPDTAKLILPVYVAFATAVNVMVPVCPRVRLRLDALALMLTAAGGGGGVT
jgi:hypothetical protein